MTPVSARDHVRGLATAPLTLVEYGDYECSYCGQVYPIVKNVQQMLGRDLRFVHRNCPLTKIHEHALHAAEVAEAVALHHKFWEVHDTLYENQNALDDESLLGYAKQLGLNADAISRAASSDVVFTQIREDMASGARSNVSGTPSFFINGVSFAGSWQQQPLVEALEQALRRV